MSFAQGPTAQDISTEKITAVTAGALAAERQLVLDAGVD
jgi:hypothetical protein